MTPGWRRLAAASLAMPLSVDRGSLMRPYHQFTSLQGAGAAKAGARRLPVRLLSHGATAGARL